MKLNTQLISKFKNSDSKLLAVTKYWDLLETKEFISEFTPEDLGILA